MLFHRLVETSQRVGARGGRLDKIAALGQLLDGLPREAVEPSVAILAGELPYGRIGVGWKTLQKSLPELSANEPSLELAEVINCFEIVRDTQGKGSVAAKTQALGELFARATSAERDFLARLLLGDLRQGALEGVMLDAVARTANVPLEDLRRAAMLAGSITKVAQAVLGEGPSALARFRLELFRPLQPMLAQPAESLADAAAQIGLDQARGGAAVAIELKLDGARIQVHRRGDVVRVYTRTLRDVTPSVPEVVEATLAIDAQELVLDGEAFAVRSDGGVHPFQTTMRRFGRKLDVSTARHDLPLRAVFFDLLHLDGETVLESPARDRYALMDRALPHALVVPRLITAEAAKTTQFLDQAIAGGHEGVMVKDLEAPYAAGRRGKAWLKVKPAHTLDLVVLAAEWGHGRRKGWLSNLHLGALDEETREFVMLGKTFKGLTDEMLAYQTETLLAHERERDGITVFVEPRLVVEIAVNEVQASPHYPAGMALRFARVKAHRPDKPTDEIDTVATVRRIFERGARGASPIDELAAPET